MSKLVLYYSYSGNTKAIAEIIASELHADIERLVPVKEMESQGFSKFIWGGSKVFMKKKPLLKQLDTDPMSYDEIFIGTPVWAWTYSPAIRTLLEDDYFSGKKVYLFCTHEHILGKTLERAKRLINERNQFEKAVAFKIANNDLQSQVDRAQKWVKTIL